MGKILNVRTLFLQPLLDFVSNSYTSAIVNNPKNADLSLSTHSLQFLTTISLQKKSNEMFFKKIYSNQIETMQRKIEKNYNLDDLLGNFS